MFNTDSVMWYYALDGQSFGPVDDAVLDQLITAGTIHRDTPVRKEGSASWSTLKFLRPSVLVEEGAACAMCGKKVGSDNLVTLLGPNFCAECKSKAVQAIREGVPPPLLHTVWKEGRKVVTRHGAVFPARCYKCNDPAPGPPVKRKLDRRVEVSIYLCPRHLRRRRSILIAACVGVFGGVAVVIIGDLSHSVVSRQVGVYLIIAGILLGLLGNFGRHVRRKGDIIWLRGAGKKFLASLPEWPPRS